VELWSVYERSPEDPGRCAVRKILVEDDGLSPAEWELFGSLHEARRVLARRGLIRVPRDAQDDPALVEVWV
jgi:DNA gyrase inhibitor GyrI